MVETKTYTPLILPVGQQGILPVKIPISAILLCDTLPSLTYSNSRNAAEQKLLKNYNTLCQVTTSLEDLEMSGNQTAIMRTLGKISDMTKFKDSICNDLKIGKAKQSSGCTAVIPQTPRHLSGFLAFLHGNNLQENMVDSC